MNPNDSDPIKLHPDVILAQSAALARHLQASGVAFLPQADVNVAKEMQQHFATPAAASVEADAIAPVRPSAPSQLPAQPANQQTTQQPAQSPPTQSPPTQSPPAIKTGASPPNRSASPPIVADTIEANYDGPSLGETDRMAKLNVLSESVAACTKCEQLAQCRTKTVFGEGSATPRFAFFGEGPGADEDRTGRPFVGKAGQLLTKMIEACTLRREDVYIFNTVKCRPPGNRNPDPSELTNCREYFEAQLAILRPEYIVCMGAISSQTLLNSKLSVGRLRGKFHRYFDSKVLVTYHPAYLLRNPDAKKAAWQDLQLMLRDSGIKT
ncbi:uracil-DNA glycosylase [Planctomycetes bacterium K23_9]|uniref:Type-4 uracil-DNA glycosylase n=1 Tax=Stieleria marina TaxID=1930275 RepID=A0A517NTH2_9BACT|nr:Uracil DNA glycosylase superfamily protein [Planctomycetes bacterium K23_9]